MVHAEKGVSERVQPICLPYRGNSYKKMYSIGIASDETHFN